MNNYIPTLRILNTRDEYEKCVDMYAKHNIKELRCCISKEDNMKFVNSINSYQDIFLQKYGNRFKILMDVSFPKDKKRITDIYGITDGHIRIGDKVTILNTDNENTDIGVAICTDITAHKVEKGDEIFVGNGECILKVYKATEEKILAVSKTDSKIKKGMALSSRSGFIKYSASEIEAKCFDLIKIVRPETIAFSYTESKEDVTYCIEKVKSIGEDYTPQIMAKIETVEGINNALEIIEVADSVMFARGCMGLNAGVEYLFYYQKLIYNICRKAKKEIYIASNIMRTLKDNNFPTRSEMCDAFSILDMGYQNIIITDQTSQADTFSLLVEWLDRMKKVVENKC